MVGERSSSHAARKAPGEIPEVGVAVRAYIKSLIIIRLNYYLTSPLTKIETVTRTSQATFTAECPVSIQERP